ncbi:MAG: MBL fold metallo-hydrolase [Planctomycetes bacterium]|nr:MBL fold metallo-hydrolase [Planctomycetota bacterium]
MMRILLIILAGFLFGSCRADNPVPIQDLAAGEFRMTVFELPFHGVAIVVQTPEGPVHIVDCGEKHDGTDAGRDVLAPFLRKLEVDRIASIVVSHPDRDHFEGAKYLFEHFRVDAFVDTGLGRDDAPKSYHQLLETAAAKSKVLQLRAAGKLDWGPSLKVEALAPPLDGIASAKKDYDNDNSIVLRIQYGKTVILLPGDIESAGCASLLAAVPAERLKSTVLVAPHHGFCDSKPLAEAVDADYVIVSCDDDYPDKKTRSPGRHATQLFGEQGARVFITSWNGNVTITSNGQDCRVESSR